MENKLFETIRQAMAETPVKITLSKPRKKSLPWKKLVYRPLMLHDQLHFQCEFHQEKKVTHENMSPDEAAEMICNQVLSAFKEVNIQLTQMDIQILANKPASPRINRHPACHKMPELSHNRKKQYLIPDGQPCDFLIHLGVMDETGRVKQSRYSKFRQINRYLEIIDDIYPQIAAGKDEITPIRIIDFGCGKAYLTFALWHYLNMIRKQKAEIIGLDLKEDVIHFCNRTAEELGYDGLRFEIGDIAGYKLEDPVDLVVTLHACDTATDYALINAVSWNTRVILSVPCCQHELFSQIKNTTLEPMLKHGIIKDRFTEILTDGLRASKLEANGYEVAMIEFTSLEHTARNIMIKAIKTSDENAPRSKKAAREYAALRDAYQVHPSIDPL